MGVGKNTIVISCVVKVHCVGGVQRLKVEIYPHIFLQIRLFLGLPIAVGHAAAAGNFHRLELFDLTSINGCLVTLKQKTIGVVMEGVRIMVRVYAAQTLTVAFHCLCTPKKSLNLRRYSYGDVSS